MSGKNCLGFSHLTQLPIKTLNDVSCINKPSKLLRKFETCIETCSVLFPEFLILGEFFIQISEKSFRVARVACLSTSTTNPLQIFYQSSYVIVRNVFS